MRECSNSVLGVQVGVQGLLLLLPIRFEVSRIVGAFGTRHVSDPSVVGGQGWTIQTLRFRQHRVLNGLQVVAERHSLGALKSRQNLRYLLCFT